MGNCPCGSGSDYQVCCGSPEGIQARSGHVAHLAALQMHQEVQRWGYARQPVQVATEGGHRFVVVDNSIFAVPEHHTFHDFLLTHLRSRLDGLWASAELGGSEGDGHPLLRWFSALQAMKLAHSQPDSPLITLHQTVAAPSVYDMLRLAYDLFTVRDAGRLESALVKRLIAKQEFAPARYELAVAACFIRAGFRLTLIDPSKAHGRPCEFIAESHDQSEVYSVEAKCRQRPGILGFPGVAAGQDKLQLDVTRLIRAAFLKDADHDRVVFIDVSLPASPRSSARLLRGRGGSHASRSSRRASTAA